MEVLTATNFSVPVVIARVNGTGPFWFIVDSGSQRTLVTEAVVQEAGLTPSYTMNFIHYDALGHLGTHRSVMIDRIELGDARFEGLAASVIANGPSKPGPHEPKYGGVLGVEAFGAVVLDIDFPARRITISREIPADVAAADASTYVWLVPQMMISVAGKKVKAVVDTGSGYALNVPELEDWPILAGGRGTTPMDILGKMVRRSTAQLNGEMIVGPLILHHPVLATADGPRIGSPALADGRLILDHSHKRLWVVKRP